MDQHPTTQASSATLFEIRDVRAVKATARALGCLFGSHDNLIHWIARSQVSRTSEVRELGDHGVLRISMWLARSARLTARQDFEDVEDGRNGKPVSL